MVKHITQVNTICKQNSQCPCSCKWSCAFLGNTKNSLGSERRFCLCYILFSE